MKNVKKKKLNYGADLKWATAHLYCKTRLVLQDEVAGFGGLYCKAGKAMCHDTIFFLS